MGYPWEGGLKGAGIMAWTWEAAPESDVDPDPGPGAGGGATGRVAARSPADLKLLRPHEMRIAELLMICRTAGRTERRCACWWGTLCVCVCSRDDWNREQYVRTMKACCDRAASSPVGLNQMPRASWWQTLLVPVQDARERLVDRQAMLPCVWADSKNVG